MYNLSLKSIAEDFNYDPDDLIDFAIRNASDYGITEENNELIVLNQYQIDRLINDYFDYTMSKENKATWRLMRLEIRRKDIIELMKLLD